MRLKNSKQYQQQPLFQSPHRILRGTLRADQVSPLTLAAWNVRPVLEKPRSNRPERRTAIVARELARYKAAIADLNETRFTEQDQLEERHRGTTALSAAGHQ
ncbi:unnamed protein product [Schistocephalus solidus]|uniref:Uncharacterized protein n=1 Tax=Schistocephalus solidus TaxID=70667 RepID=A0A183SKZ9_SCHSO|nr:unnamed protein product [Schistocephalus solidus]